MRDKKNGKNACCGGHARAREADEPTEEALHKRLRGVELVRCVEQDLLILGPCGDGFCLHELTVPRRDGLDRQAEARRDGPVVRHVRLPATVVQLLYTRRLARAPQDTVAPRRDAALLRRVVFVGPSVILVRRCEGERSLGERAQTEGAIEFHLFEELVL